LSSEAIVNDEITPAIILKNNGFCALGGIVTAWHTIEAGGKLLVANVTSRATQFFLTDRYR